MTTCSSDLSELHVSETNHEVCFSYERLRDETADQIETLVPSTCRVTQAQTGGL